MRRVDVDNPPRGTAPGDLWWLGRVGDVGGWVLRGSGAAVVAGSSVQSFRGLRAIAQAPVAAEMPLVAG